MENHIISNIFIEGGLEDIIRQAIPRIQVDKIPAMCTGLPGTLVISMNDEEVSGVIAKASQMKERVGKIDGNGQQAQIPGTGIVIDVVAILKKTEHTE